MIDCGVRGCSRDEEGVPSITFNNDTTVKFVETLVDFLWNNEGSYYVEGIPTFELMENNQVLFLCEKFSRLDMIRDMQTDFTIVPVPKLDSTEPRLKPIKGLMPNMKEIKPGCHFCERCDHALPCCSETSPENVEVTPGHFVMCHLVKKEG